jgi:hypothetical protein
MDWIWKLAERAEFPQTGLLKGLPFCCLIWAFEIATKSIGEIHIPDS